MTNGALYEHTKIHALFRHVFSNDGERAYNSVVAPIYHGAVVAYVVCKLNPSVSKFSIRHIVRCFIHQRRPNHPQVKQFYPIIRIRHSHHRAIAEAVHPDKVCKHFRKYLFLCFCVVVHLFVILSAEALAPSGTDLRPQHDAHNKRRVNFA